MNRFRLRLGCCLHFLIAIGHVACLFFLEEAFKAYDIWDEMNSLCFCQEWLLYVLTIGLAIGFVVAGLYALSASGDFAKLPLQRLITIVIISIYSIRVMVGSWWLISHFSYLQFFSTMVPAILVWCYLPGLAQSRIKRNDE